MSTSMIAGSSFEFSVDDGTTFVEVNGIPELPEFRTEDEEREVTHINDTTRQYEPGLDSPSEVGLTANYIKTDADQLAFRLLARNKGSCIVKVTYSDGDIVQTSVKLKNYGISAGGAEATKQWTCTMRRTSPITHTEAVS